MENLFSYGSLQSPDVQMATFGRCIHGASDTLVGYDTESFIDSDEERYLRAVPREYAYLEGTVLSVTETEIIKADTYEGTAYVRVKKVLQSGVEAWIYIARG